MLDTLRRRDEQPRLDPETNDGAYLDDAQQETLANKRSQKELSRAWANTNISRLLNLILGVALILAIIAWKKAEDRWANDVRVAWVKLLPNAQTQVEYWDDGGSPNRFFEAAVNASLINYVEHRFRKRKETIEADYGFALQFMGDAVREEFLNVFNAAKIAADVSSCPSCDQVDVAVRAIDHNTMVTPDRVNAGTTIVESTIYVRETTLARGAAGVAARNKLIKLTWALRPVSQVAKNLPSLKANPLAIQMLSERELDDLAQGGPGK